MLTIIDDVTKECLAAVPETSLSGKRVVREMSALIARRGKPGAIVSDNGTEFTSTAVLVSCACSRTARAFRLDETRAVRIPRDLRRRISASVLSKT